MIEKAPRASRAALNGNGEAAAADDDARQTLPAGASAAPCPTISLNVYGYPFGNSDERAADVIEAAFGKALTNEDAG